LTAQFLTHSWVHNISKGFSSQHIGLQKYFLSKENPSNSVIFFLKVELEGHSS
jgi:hypothetical protein